MKILHIIANPKPLEEANSKQLSKAFFDGLKNNKSQTEIITVDLYKELPPYYNYDTYKYFWYPLFSKTYKPNKTEENAAQYALKQIGLLNSADALVITAPMWNFGMPAILKAWIDQIIAANHAFKITKEGVKPLHRIKKVVLFTSSGGSYQERDPKEHLWAGLKAALGFVGITNFEVIWADGQNSFFFKDSKERKEKAVKKAWLSGNSLEITD